jgi:hypothetical protein
MLINKEGRVVVAYYFFGNLSDDDLTIEARRCAIEDRELSESDAAKARINISTVLPPSVAPLEWW